MRICLPALFVCIAASINALPQSANQPWSVLEVSQTSPAGAIGNTVIAPSGTIYQVWNAVPTLPVTRQYGDISQAATFLSSAGTSGAVGFVVELGGALYASALAADAAGNAYVAGPAAASGLPVTTGAYQSTPSGTNPNFLCELKPDGSLAFCTYLGGFTVSIMTIDASGAIYLLGSAVAPSTTTAGALSGGHTAVAKLSPGGSQLVFQAAINTGIISAISVDGSGNVYLAGWGTATGGTPATGSGIWVLKADGSALLYSSFVLNAGEKPVAMTLDGSANVYWTGTESDGSLFVRKYEGYGPSVAFEYYTLKGQQSPNSPPIVTPVAIAVDSSEVVSVAGYTTALNFPTYQTTLPCNSVINPPANLLIQDGFLLRFSPAGSLLQSTYLADGGLPLALSATAAAAYIPATTSNGDVILMTLGAQASVTAGLAFTCIGNAASLTLAGIVPGEVVSLFGSGMGPQQGMAYQLDASQQIGTKLADTEVTFGGIPAPLLYVQDQQINAIVPWEAANQTRVEVCVSYQGSQTNCIPAAIVPGAPGVFQSSPGVAAAVNQDGSINSPANPAPMGSIVSIYATGTGVELPLPADGTITQSPLPTLFTPVQVLFEYPEDHDAATTVTYSGPAPLEPAGVTQVNFKVTSSTWYLYMTFPDGTSAFSPGFSINVK